MKMKPRTIARPTAWRLLERIGSNLHKLRNSREIKISHHVYLSIHGHGTGKWVYMLSGKPQHKVPAPAEPEAQAEPETASPESASEPVLESASCN